MKKYIIAACCLLMTTGAFSQNVWSFRDCIDYALDNNVELKKQDLQIKSAEVDLSTSKNSRLPDLNASIGQNFNFGRSPSASTGVYESQNTSNTSFGISSGLPIFTGFRIPNQIKSDEMSVKAATQGLLKAQENLQLEIASYYLDILLKKELLKIYQEQVALTQTQVTRTEILVESGKVPMSQLYDIRSQLANDELNVTTADNNVRISLLNLSQLLNLPFSDNFDIEIPNIENMFMAEVASGERLSIPDEVYQRAIEIKPHVKEYVYRVQSSKYNMEVAKAGYWPTLNLGLSYNNAYGYAYGLSDDQKNRSFSNQIKDNYRAAIGFSLSIPIFNRFDTRNRVRKARLDIDNEELNLMNVKLNLYKEIQQAYQNSVAARATYISTEKAYEAAAESFRYAEERYQVGKSTVFEYNEAQTKLINSRSEQLRAKYDFVFRNKILDFYQGKQIDI